MTQRIVIPLFVVLGFGAGFGARMWTERDPALPPPPAAGSEFVRSSTAPVSDAKTEARPASAPRPDRAKLIKQIDDLRPQIESYRKRVDEIDGDFDRAFVALLNPEQRAHYEAQQKKDADRRAKRQAHDAASNAPLSDEQIAGLQQGPLWSALYKIAPTWRLERATRDYKLDSTQQAAVHELLLARREKFIALLDASTPPSIG